MGLTYKFNWAEKFISRLSPQEKTSLISICKSIQSSEDSLQAASAEIMTSCNRICGGICCRNADLDAIIGGLDFLFLLALHWELKGKIVGCLKKEDFLFTQNCIFLQNGVGPCILPDNGRPLVCITTFCKSEEVVKKELGEVKRTFNKLVWFVRLRPARELKRWLKGRVSKIKSNI